jgi:hypothetical protein
MRNGGSMKIIPLVVVLLLTACSADVPEVPPTTILGASIIFTYDQGLVRCKTIDGKVQRNDADGSVTYLTDLKIKCYAAMPVADASTSQNPLPRLFDPFSTVVDTSVVAATEFAPDIKGTLWNPLYFETGGIEYNITDYLIDTSGMYAVYTISADQVTTDKGQAQSTLDVARSIMEQKTINYDYQWAPEN